jgi:hypothetical protein
MELFRLASRIALQAILSEKNLLLRLRLIKKFFGVCVNLWEKHSILGPVPSAETECFTSRGKIPLEKSRDLV